MPRPTKGARLGSGPTHQKLMLNGLASQLIIHERIRTTQTKAMRLRPVADGLITLGKDGSVHALRRALSMIEDRDVVHKLFSEVAPRFADRSGGYTRVLKLGPRQGDAAPMAIIELVEGEIEKAPSPQTEERRRRGLRRRKPAKSKKPEAAEDSAEETAAEALAEPEAVEEEAAAEPETVEETAAPAEDAPAEVKVETAAAEPPAEAEAVPQAEENPTEKSKEHPKLLPNHRLTVAYDGGGFHGFARQPGLETVQGSLEGALSKIFAEEVHTSGAGRTDAGVHALGQVVSFRTENARDLNDVQQKLNAMCGPEVAVVRAEEASEGFDARFSAEARSYEYAILNRKVHDPFSRHTTWHHPAPLDHELMGKAAGPLLGEHSFESFGRVEEGKNPIRRVESLEIERTDDLIAIRITANSFLQQMVRSIVGTLAKAGTGAIPATEMDKILHARTRSAAGPVAPPHGLFLVSVSYPAELSSSP